MDSRNVDAAYPGQGLELLLPFSAPAPDGHHGGGDLPDGLLPLADDEGVDEGAHRSGVEGGWAAGDDQRVPLVPFLPAERNPAQFEHHQDVRVGELVLEGEADDVEGGKRPLRFQGAEGEAASAQQGLHVRPGGVAALAADVRQAVQDGVEDLEPEVGHPDLVGVGEGEGDAEAAGPVLLPDGVHLAAGVTAWLFDGEEQLAGIESCLVGHSFCLSRDCRRRKGSCLISRFRLYRWMPHYHLYP